MGNTHNHHHEDNSHLVKQAEERMQKEKHEHETRMKELDNANKEKKREQLKKNITHVNKIINELNISVKKDQNSLKIAKENEASYNGKKVKLEDDISKFRNHKNSILTKFKIQLGLDAAEEKYKHDFNEISNAVETTGQNEENIHKFLQLTLSLIGATMNCEAETNKLDIALLTFGKIMNDECQDKLTIDSYFNDNNLERFITILLKEGYKTLDDLICDDNETFENDILMLCENGIKELESDHSDIKEEIKQEHRPIKEGDALCIELLNKWKLNQYWNKLKDDGWDDAEDWIELTQDDLIDIINKNGHRKKFIKQVKKWKDGDKFKSLKQMELKHLKKICLQAETWNTDQNKKIEITKLGLLELSPIMALFFGRMNEAVIQISELLSYKKDLSNMQLNAIKMRNKNNKKLKLIKYRKFDNEERRKWINGSCCKIYSDSFSKWFAGKIIEIKRDNEGEWLSIEYNANNEKRNKQVQRYSDAIKPIINKDVDDAYDIDDDYKEENEMDIQKQCSSLITASIIDINVTDSMLSEFNKNNITERGLTLAHGVEYACMRIIHGQGQIRKSVFLAQEILNYKPSNINNNKTKQLWNAIDNGITQIFKSALEMVKVSAQYFAFFLRFKSSFQYYISCYTNDNVDTKLIVSLERLRKDVRDFNGFTNNFTKKIEELSSTSMDCIEQCVKAQIGAKNWEDTRNSLKRTEKRYLELKKLYDQKGFELDNDLDKKKQQQIHFQQKEIGAIYQVNLFTKRIKQNNDYLIQCQDALAELNKVIV